MFILHHSVFPVNDFFVYAAKSSKSIHSHNETFIPNYVLNCSEVEPENRGEPFLEMVKEYFTSLEDWKRSVKPRIHPQQLQQLLATPQCVF